MSEETMRRMRRPIAILLFLITPAVWAQLSDQATLRTQAVEEPITIVQQNGVVYLPLDRIVLALGGEFNRTDRGFSILLDGQRVSFGPGDLEAVAGETLISLGDRPPIVIESRPFVPIRFVRDLLRAIELEPDWDQDTKTISIQPLRRESVRIDASLTRVGPLTKLVFELSQSTRFSIVRRPGSYVIQFRNPIRATEDEIDFEDPLVSRLTFGPSSAEIFLRTPEVAADSYRLDDPPRLILDLTRSAEAAEPPSPRPTRRQTPVDSSAIDTIVVDPGHGGTAVGAQGPTGALEKELTLQISRKLRDILAARGFRVILTRNEDVLLDLDQRTAIANQYKADLFLSVHLNAVPFQSARGAETYFLSLEATDERARLSAERENADQPQAQSAGSDLDLILWDLAQQRYLKESSRFAELIQDEMAAATGIERRGVKQAPFRVLLGAMMPAALVEVGFISNPEEEIMLVDPAHQEQIAMALSEAVSRYKAEYEKRAGNLKLNDESESAVSTSSLGAEMTRSEP